MAIADEAPLLKEEKKDRSIQNESRVKEENADDLDISDAITAMFDLLPSPGEVLLLHFLCHSSLDFDRARKKKNTRRNQFSESSWVDDRRRLRSSSWATEL